MSRHARDGCEGCVVGLFATTTLLFYFVLPGFGVVAPAWLYVALAMAYFVLVMASWLEGRNPPSRQPRQQGQPRQEQPQDEQPQA